MKISSGDCALKHLTLHTLPNGGFADRRNGHYRPDATAWAVIVLSRQLSNSSLVDQARQRLVADQLPDGRIPISPQHPDAYWPTTLCILAWHRSPPQQQAKDRAVQFLLKFSGLHWEKSDDSPIGHDTSIPGWSWIDQTHSWVPPTAMAMIGLSEAGLANHPRLEQATRMLLDRQFPMGGWNYGNTTVFGKTLRPFPETTGMALNALAQRVTQKEVDQSLNYLLNEIPRLRTPLSLGWAILGLKAWGLTHPKTDDWVQETLDRESVYGGYSTPSLCVLLAGAAASGGLESVLANQETDSFKNSIHP